MTLGFGLTLGRKSEVDSTMARVEPTASNHLATGEEVDAFGSVSMGVTEE